MADTQPISAHLFALIDAYALACAEREVSQERAEWAFMDAHRAMLSARTAVATALRLSAVDIPPLTDSATRLAEHCARRGATEALSSQAGLASLRGGILAQQEGTR